MKLQKCGGDVLELSERKKAILVALIKSYIYTGEPIGSKALCSILDFNVSSATLRNEMSELCEMGLLEQPHTSAGRIPTNHAYRLYIDTLMDKKVITDSMKQAIDSLLGEAARDPEHLTSVAGQILADLTGLPTLLATVANNKSYVRRVELMTMGRRTVLIVLITSDGVARSRICRTDSDLSAELIATFDRLISAKIVGAELDKFNTVLLQTLVVETGGFALSLTPLITAIFEMAQDIHKSKVSLGGESNLMPCYGNENDVRRLLNLVSRQNTLISLLQGINRSVDVVFGDVTGIDELKPSNMVVAKYSLGSEELGRIGVIGPTRMAYEQVIPGIEYFALKLGNIMKQTMRDLEDYNG
ncbi:MAG: heat-inducible transcriptional repressor HrcA [Oscillospiraceae bacterium]